VRVPSGKNGTFNKNIKAMWFGVGDRCSTSRQEWNVKQEHQGHVVYALFVKVKQEHQGHVVYALLVTLKSKIVTLKSKEFNDPFTNKGTVHFVDKTSFKANLNQHAQDTQFMFIIVKHFILPAVETEKDNKLRKIILSIGQRSFSWIARQESNCICSTIMTLRLFRKMN
jgi:hypothetical protein